MCMPPPPCHVALPRPRGLLAAGLTGGCGMWAAPQRGAVHLPHQPARPGARRQDGARKGRRHRWPGAQLLPPPLSQHRAPCAFASQEQYVGRSQDLPGGRGCRRRRRWGGGAQVKYVVELCRALSLHPAVHRVELLTRLINDPKVRTCSAQPGRSKRGIRPTSCMTPSRLPLPPASSIWKSN